VGDEAANLETSTTEPAKPKGLLYHYTTQEGFLGILESDSLRATHIRYMNDSKEFIDALEHLGGFIDEFDISLRSSLRYFMRSSIRFSSGRNAAYIISFTDDEAQLTHHETVPGDRLSQWRSYSGGKGISLGLDYRSLDRSGSGRSWRMEGAIAYLLECSYGNEDKRGYFQRLGESMAKEAEQDFERFAFALLSNCETMAKTLDAEGFRSAEFDALMASVRQHRIDLTLALLVNATLFKDVAFFEEKEWRTVILPFRSHLSADDSSDSSEIRVKFRSGALGITPYIDFPLGLRAPDSPLRRIVVGPTPHMEEAVKGVEMLLEDKGIRPKSKDFPDGVEVVPSQIPYRNW
jgi:hypothetical protein